MINMNIWTIESEFKDSIYNKIELTTIYQIYMNKLLQILLLRDLNFYQLFLSKEMYEEFNQKINIYCNINGFDIKNCSLYFTVYNFSDELAKIILDLRNKYGLYLLFLVAFPYESFNNEAKEISIDLKNINKNFSIRKLLQEITFDLGCSSYTLGNIYDYHNKMCNNKELLDDITFNNINININKMIISTLKIYTKCKNILSENELSIINQININKVIFIPLNFIITNKIILFLIKDLI